MRVGFVLAMALSMLVAGCVFPVPGRSNGPTPYFVEVIGGAPFTELVIELDHAPQRRPSAAAVEHLTQTFRNITNKQSVTVLLRESLSDTPEKRWTGDELVKLERDTRDTVHAAPTAVLHVLYPAGRFEQEGVAGVAVGGPVIGPIVVFLDELRDMQFSIEGNQLPVLPTPAGTVEILERATLLHEAGHAIGLVDNGMPMVRDHRDPDNGPHSKNRASVMYYALETTAGLRDMLLDEGNIPDKFDVDDLRDIAASGGRG